MYGGSGKLGRGGGGGRGVAGAGAGKRNIHSTFHPPPLNRASAGPTGRLSMPGSGPRGRTNTSSSGGAAPSSSGTGTEETFSLVTGNPLDFAMIIRLAPDLVEEIKRVEGQGGSARIKFDANANNPAGNVINVGSKDFRFTWSREPGDLCDIYEERKSGEDGNGMLVESGCAWRKLNVQRVLDESTKNHVKMRSEEAERKHKSRKAIVLDPANPSMKRQMEALAAAETNPWRMPFKQKKEPPFKKRKTEPPPGGAMKSTYKSGMSTTPSKGRPSASPRSPPPEQSGAPGSPLGNGNRKKGRASMDNILSAQALNKTASSEKEMPGRVISSGGRDKQGRRGEVAKPADLRSMLVSLLKENPSGMSLKALEKAVGDGFPNSAKQIEPIIKKIATYQAPGKYLLKPGPEIEGFKKPSATDGSSPSDNHRSPVHTKYDQPRASEPSFSMRTESNEFEEFGQLDSKSGEASDDFEKIDIEHHSPDLSGEKKNSDRVGPVGSSSDSGSDSDSESDSSDSGSDSGSRSRSRSKSKSPRGSASESSSDSESDASLNSKEASDEDVDIMTSDDEKESKQNLQASVPGALKSPSAWRAADGEPGKIGTDEKQGDDDDVDVVEIEKDLLDDDHDGQMAGARISVFNKEGHGPEEETKPPPSERNELRDSLVYAENSHSQRGNMARKEPKREQSKSSDRVSKSKSKRGLNEKHSDGKPESSKRLKTTNSNRPFATGIRNLPSAESPYKPSPSRLNIQIAGSTAREGTVDLLQKDYGQEIYGKSDFETQQPSRRSYDPGARPKAPAAVDRPAKHAESAAHGVKYSERSLLTNEGSPLQREKSNREEQNDDSFIKDKKSTKFSKEGVGDKQATAVDSNYGKRDMLGKFKKAGSVSNMQMLYSSKDENTNDVHRSPVENGRRNNLQREPSDLELGELREPPLEETPGHKKLFERKSSFKQTESRPVSSDYWNSDSGKPAGKLTSEHRQTPPANATKAFSGILEGSKRRSLDNFANDSTRYHHGIVQPHPEQNQSRTDRTEPGSLYNKLAEVNSNNRESDPSMGLATVSLPQQHDVRRGVVSLSSRENKKSQSSTSIDDRPKDTSRTESNDGGQKRRESSSDENSWSYSKYEKEEPELKGPIKDLSQYEEYVQEYNEKYESYLSLNKILESYRNEFSQLGRDLEASRGRDTRRYFDLLAQLKESYRQCGAKHKRLKKIFIVLHEELKHLKQMIKDFATSYMKD